MQPADDTESLVATKTLKDKGICNCDLTKNDVRLKPVAFGSRSCNENERNFHSFTGEGACGRWVIGWIKQYLWGCHFYWMCDYSAIKEILEYGGSIPIICRQNQELLGYQFTFVHMNAIMMINVDGLTRRFGKLIACHCVITQTLQ